MARKKKFRIPGLSFSWKRATGLTALKQRVARTTGIPLTREGRRRKFGPFGLWPLFGGGRSSAPRYAAASSGSSHVGCFALLALAGLGTVAACGGFSVIGWLMSVDSPAAPQAQAAPVALTPAVQPEPIAAAAPQPTIEPALRTWTSADGKFTTEAAFGGAIGSKVMLKKADGSVINVQREQLSEADRAWLADRRRRQH